MLNGGRRCITCSITYYRGVAKSLLTGGYGGTAPKFCMFHKRGLLPLPPVEHTKLRSCTFVVRISWTAETLQNFVPPLSVSETQVNKRLLVSYYKFADVQTSDHGQY